MEALISIKESVGLMLGWFLAFCVEKHYISRPALIVNVFNACFLMNGTSFYEKFKETWRIDPDASYFSGFKISLSLAWEAWKIPLGLKLYLCFGVLLSLFGFLSYLSRKRQSKDFYDLIYRFYSSKTLMPLSTAFVLFSHYAPELLYQPRFKTCFVFFFVLSWRPLYTFIVIVAVFVAAYVYAKFIK